MALILPSESEILFLDFLLESVYTYHLYKNDVDPDEDTVLADFTEANFVGYAAQDAEDWDTAAIDGGRAVSEAEDLYWEVLSSATANSIYGYYVTDADGELAWCEQFAGAPYTMDTAGQRLGVTPRLTLRSEF